MKIYFFTLLTLLYSNSFVIFSQEYSLDYNHSYFDSNLTTSPLKEKRINTSIKKNTLHESIFLFDSIFFNSLLPLDTSLSKKIKQVNPELYDNWKKTLYYYEQQYFFEAIDLLKIILNEKDNYYNQPQILTLFEQVYILLIECYLQVGNLEQAKKIISKIKREINFNLKDYLRLEQSKVDILSGQNFKAVLQLIKNMKFTPFSYVYTKSKNLLFEIIKQKGLSNQELQKLMEHVNFNTFLMSQTLQTLAQQQTEKENYQSAQISYQTWLSLFPEDSLAPIIQEKLTQILDKQDRRSTILLMLPLSNSQKKLGTTIFKGIKLRLEEENNPPYIKIIDTKTNPIHTIQALRKELYQSNIIGIIGPVLSVTSIAVAIELSNSNIPIITPTANQQGIGFLGNNFFQINSIPQNLGKSIFQYAKECLHVKKFVILAPNNNYGRSMSKVLEEEIQKSNLSLIYSQYYNPNNNNYSKVIQSLKGVLFQDLIQKEIAKKNIFYLDDPLEKHMKQSVKDSTLNIEGLFVITNNTKEAVDLYNQLQYHKIKTNILGVSEWKNSKLTTKKSNPIFFATDFYNYKTQPRWKYFAKKYQNRWKSLPTKVSSLAYDATHFFLLGKSDTPEETLKNLQDITEFQSVRGLFTMNKHHNQNTNIILNWNDSKLKPTTCTVQ